MRPRSLMTALLIGAALGVSLEVSGRPNAAREPDPDRAPAPRKDVYLPPPKRASNGTREQERRRRQMERAAARSKMKAEEAK